MNTIQFQGFAGVRLEAEVSGHVDDPAVLLLHGAAQTRAVWRQAAEALSQAGRRVINLDLRGHGASEWPADGRYDFDAQVQDLRMVLAQLGSRPVVVASTLGAWIATVALGSDAPTLATGLVLVDVPTEVTPAQSDLRRERLRKHVLGQAQPEWDVRILDRLDDAAVPQMLADAAQQIKLPVLYVRGVQSRLVTGEQAAAFVGRFDDAEFIEVAEADLLITPDRTEVFNAVLLDFLERKHPRGAPEFRAGTDPRTLRDALGCFATGVTIVTTKAPDGKPIGLTANSFTSVSLDPPLLLVCIARSAGSAPVLESAATFGVNVLQIGQQMVSNRFAGKGEDRFADQKWHWGETGAPVLEGSLSSFECARHEVLDGGDHFILVGRVIKATFEPRRDPLLYFRGKYRRLHFA